MTRTRTASTTPVIGSNNPYAASPNVGSRTSRISSLPYAEEEMQSLESTPSASFLESFSCLSWSVVSGGPSSLHLSR